MKFTKALLYFSLFTFHFSLSTVKAQDAYMLPSDTNNHGLFNDFIGIKFFVSDLGASNAGQVLTFDYVSNNSGYLFQFNRTMNVKTINNLYNIGLGINENEGKHLQLNFFNVSVGYIQNTLNWNLSSGAGYFISLNQSGSIRLTGYVNLYYENISYSLGSYIDTTGLGFIIDGVNVGTTLREVKYINNIWAVSPGLEVNFRRRNIDFFAGISYNYVFLWYDKINFYIHSIPVSEAIYYPNGNPVTGNILNLNKYAIHIGVIREFGL